MTEGRNNAFLEVKGLSKYFTIAPNMLGVLSGKKPRQLRAVNDVSFAMNPGEVLGVVGESGCGKSTLGRCIIGIHQPTSGEVIHNGQRVTTAKSSTGIQMIFQDPYSSLNPRMTISQTLAEVVRFCERQRTQKNGADKRYVPKTLDRGEVEIMVDALLDTVGLAKSSGQKYPHALSGGQRQRISIARALAAEPDLIVADEPVSALDVSVQAQIINLFAELKHKLGLTIIFIAHDLAVVRHLCDRVAVMYLGEIVELNTTEALFVTPRHPYTQALIASIPVPDPDVSFEPKTIVGEVATPFEEFPGCQFVSRCPHAVEQCGGERQILSPTRDGGQVRCFRAFEVHEVEHV